LLLLVLLLIPGCQRNQQAGEVRYVVGQPYEIGGTWRYPRENFAYDETGIATQAASSTAALTVNGEPNDQSALIAQHRTLQLPAIVRITNLENGRQVVVRVNDRGPADPARVIAVSRRTADLLAPASRTAFRVRVQVLSEESQRLANFLQNRPGAPPSPDLPRVAAAPRGGVSSEALAPPPGVAGRAPPPAAPAPRASAPASEAPEIPLRLPEAVTAVAPRPGQLAIECGRFGRLEYADVMRRRIARLNPRVTTDYNAPRDEAYIVRLGPFATLAQAEANLREALAMGVPDARIVLD
jgi:rare lipoprotein A